MQAVTAEALAILAAGDARPLRTALLAAPLDSMCDAATAVRDLGAPRLQTWSSKVFIPLTQLCRDRCHYCTFAHPPRPGEAAYLTPDAVLEIARTGARMGCTEALFTLGDKPELRWAQARAELDRLGYATTIDYLAAMCRVVLDETGLLPHVNAGVMGRDELAKLRAVSVSQGLMLETMAERLSGPGGPHHRSPDKEPAARLETIRLAGELAIPFTSGILIGLGETLAERLDALFALRDLNDAYDHIGEIIVQNFRAKPRTPMANASEPDLDDLRWSIAAARLVLGSSVAIQAPPNLSAPESLPALIAAGIDDWGGVSPVTPDHVNPEAPWPELEVLRDGTAAAGRILAKRLPIYPRHAANLDRWVDPALHARVRAHADTTGLARDDRWSPGVGQTPVLPPARRSPPVDPALVAIVDAAFAGEALGEAEIGHLFAARDADFVHICEAADALRAAVVGDIVTYAVNRNINYTNICTYRCGFCAFSKGRGADSLRGAPYDLDAGEVVRRAREAWDRGATEVCMQGGIHPHYTGATYLDLTRAVKAALPEMHIHAFSPLEVEQGAATLGLSVANFLAELKAAGLGTLPGTAAEILDDEVRAIICPDKLSTAEWLEVVETAHATGLRTTSTIMFGHVDQHVHWARHLLRLRALQTRTGGITEFVPLPFVHMEAPLAMKGLTRKGPTLRETILMHAVARLALHPLVPNIQTSWVKLGAAGAKLALRAGANDLGGTLMNESISRAAGTQHGQELPPDRMEALIVSLGRLPSQRTTLYEAVSPERRAAARVAAPLKPVVNTLPRPRRILEAAE